MAQLAFGNLMINSQSGLGKYRLGDWLVKVQLASISDTDIVRVSQEHGVRIIAAGDSGPADGLITDSHGSAVGISTADCLPLVVVTPDNALALHVSRKTLIAGQLDQVPAHFKVANITHAFIGSHICSRHFTFDFAGPDIAAYLQRWPQADVSQLPVHLDLATVVTSYLTTWRVPPDKIVRSNNCTFEQAGLPSYRRFLRGGQKLQDGIITSVRHIKS